MPIAVLGGVGAMDGIFAGSLQKAGAKAAPTDASGDAIRAVNNSRLSINARKETSAATPVTATMVEVIGALKAKHLVAKAA